MELLRVVIASCTALLAVSGASSCGGLSREIVAEVGGAAITKDSYEHWRAVGVALGSSRPGLDAIDLPASDPPAVTTLKRWTLDFLISAARVSGEAAERGIVISDTEARRALEDFQYERLLQAGRPTAQEARLEMLLSSKAESNPDRVWIMKLHVLSERLRGRLRSEAEQSIPAGQLARYYARHRARFITPELRDVYVIETFRKSKAALARREIESGKDIRRVVERRDDEPQVGGAKLGMTRRSLTHPYEQNYFKAKLHELVGPLKAEIYYLFEVFHVARPRLRALSEAQPEVRHELIAGSQRHLLTVRVGSLEEKWRSRTRCASSYVVEQCGRRL